MEKPMGVWRDHHSVARTYEQSQNSVPVQGSFGFISITRIAKRIRAAGPCVVVVGGGSDRGEQLLLGT